MDSGVIRFYDRDYHLLGIDDDAETIYTSRWNSYGSFEFFLKEMHPGVKEGNRIIMDDDGRKNGIITYIGIDEDKVTIRGYSLLWLLAKRITIPKTGKAYLTYSGTVEDVLYGLVNDNAVNAADAKRNFPNLECAASQGRGSAYTYQTRYDNLLECLQEVSAYSMAGIGIRVIPEEAREIFEVRWGKDKSIDQTLNPQVVFRQSYDNILSEIYAMNSENYRNMAYVGGQGEGIERAIVKVGDESTGEDRCEIFVDARDIEDTSKLADRGQTKLAECSKDESFEVSADSNGYGTRWDLGDKVTVYGEDSGVLISDHITQITETVDETGVTLSPVFGLAVSGIGGGSSSGTTSSKMDYSNPFDAVTTIANGTDWNDVTDIGIYTVWGSNYVNAPAAAFYGYLQVVRYHGTYVSQLAVRASASTTANIEMYIRRKINSGWGNWNQIL